ncbi:hypothetical protein M0804_009421 [Polistes exclamans]|nr:hypothetical protein M0804_009421 [Polistes exclamans]
MLSSYGQGHGRYREEDANAASTKQHRAGPIGRTLTRCTGSWLVGWLVGWLVARCKRRWSNGSGSSSSGNRNSSAAAAAAEMEQKETGGGQERR